jgi:hypothetical protein
MVEGEANAPLPCLAQWLIWLWISEKDKSRKPDHMNNTGLCQNLVPTSLVLRYEDIGDRLEAADTPEF